MPTRILLVGAGAIGAFYASRLATLPNISVSALCRSNYAVVRKQGLLVTSPNFPRTTFKPEFTFRDAAEAVRETRERRLEWAFLVVATKALPDVGDDSALLEGLVSEGGEKKKKKMRTAIVLLQNGVGVEEAYRRRFPRASVLSAVVIASCEKVDERAVRHHRWTRISVGPYLPSDESDVSAGNAAAASERSREFVDLLRQGGIEDAVGYDHAGLQFLRWHKVAINASMNPTAVLAGGCTTQEMAKNEELSEHLIGVMEEVLAAAPIVLGRPLPKALPTPAQVLKSTMKDDSGSRPSMWMDWEGGKRMELEVILGNPIRLAREKGVAMPRLQAMYAMLKMAQDMREREKKARFSKL